MLNDFCTPLRPTLLFDQRKAGFFIKMSCSLKALKCIEVNLTVLSATAKFDCIAHKLIAGAFTAKYIRGDEPARNWNPDRRSTEKLEDVDPDLNPAGANRR